MMKKKICIAIVVTIGMIMFYACNQTIPENEYPTPEKNEKTGKWGYVYKEKTIIKHQYDGADVFSSGLARVEMDGAWGFIDKTGIKVIPFKYETSSNFDGDLAKVSIDGKYGYIDKTGTEVIPVKYESIGDFADGFASVESNGKHGFVDKTGTEIIPLEFEEIGTFKKGMVQVKQKGEYSYIDMTGKAVRPSNSTFAIIRFSTNKVEFKVLSETKFYTLSLTDGSKTYEANMFSNSVESVRWANGSQFWPGSSLQLPAIYGVGAMTLLKGTELSVFGFGTPKDFNPTIIKFNIDGKTIISFDITTSEWN